MQHDFFIALLGVSVASKRVLDRIDVEALLNVTVPEGGMAKSSNQLWHMDEIVPFRSIMAGLRIFREVFGTVLKYSRDL